jgi:hypothetical protein
MASNHARKSRASNQFCWFFTGPYNAIQPVQSIRSVEIDFPFRPAAFDDEKAALLVDGQQRTAALSMVDIEKVPAVALSVMAVIADADEAKRVF